MCFHMLNLSKNAIVKALQDASFASSSTMQLQVHYTCQNCNGPINSFCGSVLHTHSPDHARRYAERLCKFSSLSAYRIPPYHYLGSIRYRLNFRDTALEIILPLLCPLLCKSAQKTTLADNTRAILRHKQIQLIF